MTLARNYPKTLKEYLEGDNFSKGNVNLNPRGHSIYGCKVLYKGVWRTAKTLSRHGKSKKDLGDKI